MPEQQANSQGQQTEVSGWRSNICAAVLCSTKQERGNEGGNPKCKNATLMHHVVLMDGGNVCFTACASSGLTDKMLVIGEVSAGDAITTKDHHFLVWLWDETLLF